MKKKSFFKGRKLNIRKYFINTINTIPEILVQKARKFAEKNAMVLEEGVTISFRDMMFDVRETAGMLRSYGACHGKTVVLFADSTPQSVETFYSVLSTGAVAVLLRYDLSTEEINMVLKEQKPCAVFINGEKASMLPEHIEIPVFEMKDNRLLKEVSPEVLKLRDKGISYAKVKREETAVITYQKSAGVGLDKNELSHAKLIYIAKPRRHAKNGGHSFDALVEYIRLMVLAMITGKPVDARLSLSPVTGPF